MPEEKIAAAKVTLMGQLQAALAEVKGVNPQVGTAGVGTVAGVDRP